MEDLQEVAAQLFVTIIGLDPKEQGAYLSNACESSPELRRQVEQMLEEDRIAGTFLQRPLFEELELTESGSHSPDAPYQDRQQNASPVRLGHLPQFAIGDLIYDRFEVIRFIARGGMGEVYEVVDRQLRGARVALKTVLSQYAADPVMQERLEREVLNARGVVHPNLCPIYDIFHWNRPEGLLTFLTMKLLAGETLSARLTRDGAIPEPEASSIVRQVGSGLSAAHNAGILHRDIKAMNIILDGRGETVYACVTDFGLARTAFGEMTVLTIGGIAGTPGYMAPELLFGASPSKASDVFSFGVVGYQVLTGHLPGHSFNQGASHSVEALTEEFPAPWKHFLRGCLEPNLERRFKDIPSAVQSLEQTHIEPREHLPLSRFLTRRTMLAVTAASCAAVAGAAWLERERLVDLFEPLPSKRFVALLVWPKTADAQVTPMLNAALAAIKSELSRFESVDRDLFVISPEDLGGELTQTSGLKDICDALGANLVLGASALPGAGRVRLILRLLDPISGHSLRERTIETTAAAVTLLPQKAVEAASALLSLPEKLAATLSLAGPGTRSAAAFTAFEAAESLMKQPNDTGLQPAIEKYKQAVDLDPRYAVAYAKLGIAYCRLAAVVHDPAALQLARRNCETSLALNPNLVHSYAALAHVLQQTGDDQGALNEFGRALAIDPSDAMTLVWKAQLYTKLNRWQDAEQTLKRVIALRPNYWFAYNALGLALNSQGKYAEAIDQFRAACVAAPGSALAFSNVGAVYLQIGHYSEAVDYLKKSFALQPNPLAAANISSALRSQGKASEALPYAKQAVALDSADHWNWMELADCYSSLPGHQTLAKQAYQRAASAAEHHLETDPSDGASWMQLALYEVKSGQSQGALSMVKKAESLGAGDVDSQLCKARILELQGRREEAIAVLKECFLKGATDFQVTLFPDMRSLQRDARYRRLLTTKTDSTGAI